MGGPPPVRPDRRERRGDIVLLRRRHEAGDLRLAGRTGSDLRRHRGGAGGGGPAAARRELSLGAARDRDRQQGFRRNPAALEPRHLRPGGRAVQQGLSGTPDARGHLPGYVRLECPPLPPAPTGEESDDAEVSEDDLLEFAADRVAELAAKSPGRRSASWSGPTARWGGSFTSSSGGMSRRARKGKPAHRFRGGAARPVALPAGRPPGARGRAVPCRPLAARPALRVHGPCRRRGGGASGDAAQDAACG